MTKNHDHITTLKAAADPQRVAAALGLQGRGKRFFCPSCQPDGGKTPDLSVRDKGFTCHKCGLKGDLLKLIELADGPAFCPYCLSLYGAIRGPVFDRDRRGRNQI